MSLPEEIKSLLVTIKPYTLLTEARLLSLSRICKYLNEHGIIGDFVECGTYKGGSAALISRYLGEVRQLWLYDSFAGMPATTERDGLDAQAWIGECLAGVADVQEVLQLVATPPERYHIKQGWFQETFQEKGAQQVALLHCDADWYESVRLVLETFYERIPQGGCVVLDDFGYWEGCREAFYDFCCQRGEKPLLERVDRDQAFWIKGRSHNRVLIPTLSGTWNEKIHQNEPEHFDRNIMGFDKEFSTDLKVINHTEELQYTGERHMTGQVGHGLSLGHIDHMVRYAFVSPFVKNQRVLDISCGSGYGTQFMAIQGASQVTGVDIDEKSLEYARQFHPHERVDYIQSDAHAVPQLEDHSFDVIVAFETIEHLHNPRAFLVELRRLLKPGGCCFISCPNDYRDYPWISEFHLHKFKFAEFRDLVVEIFAEATFLGQHNTSTSSLLKPHPTSETTCQFAAYRQPLAPNFWGNQYLDSIAPIENAMGYLAIVGVDSTRIVNHVSISEDAFQQVMSGFRYAQEQQEWAQQAATVAQQQVSELQQQLQQQQQTYTELQQQWQAEIEALQTQLHQSQTALQDCQTHLDQTQTELHQTQTELHQTQTKLHQTQSQLHQTQTALEECQTHLHQTQTALKAEQTQLAQHRSLLQRTQNQLERSQSQLQQKQTKLQQLRGKLKAARSHVKQLQGQLGAIETSKFWQLRQSWLRLKRNLGLKGEQQGDKTD